MASLTNCRRQGLVSLLGPCTEIDVKRDDRGIGLVQLTDDLGMVTARPGPAAQFRQASGVDFDDCKLAAWRARQQFGTTGRQGVLGRTKQPAGGENRRRHRD